MLSLISLSSASSIVLLLCAVLGMLATLLMIPLQADAARADVKAVIYGATWWIACALAENLPVAPAVRLFFGNLAWFAIAALPLALCRLLWTATHGRHASTPKSMRAAAWTFVVCVGCIAFLNPYKLMYREIIPAVDNQGPLRYVHGPAFFWIILVLYAALFAAMTVTAWQQQRRPRRQRRIHLGLILSVIAPILASAAYASGHLLFLSYDPSPFAFLITAPVLAWLLKRTGLCDPLPMAREALMGLLVDGILVTDTEGYVVTCNAAAIALPGFPKNATGRPLDDLPNWSETLLAAIAKPGTGVLFHAPMAGTPTYFDVSAQPLHDGSMPVGQLLLVRDVTRYRLAENRLRETLAQLTQQLAENVGLQETLKAQAHRDPLTNLYNRRALSGFLPGLLDDSALSGTSVSAVMIDIDYFKSINDRFGHSAGDLVLQDFATKLTLMMRKRDLAFRMGGEEFLVLLPDTGIKAAIVIAERWLDAFRLGLDVGGERISLTLSAGIAARNGADPEAHQLIHDADSAAYHSKNNGRDQLTAFDRHALFGR